MVRNSLRKWLIIALTSGNPDPLQLRALLCRGDIYHMMYNEALAREARNEEKKMKQRARTSSHNTFIQKATRDYSRVIHMYPGNYLLYLYRGRLLLKQGYFYFRAFLYIC
jgi:hypothetical protein